MELKNSKNVKNSGVYVYTHTQGASESATRTVDSGRRRTGSLEATTLGILT